MDFSIGEFDRSINFTSGSGIGDMSCTNFTIIDDTVAELDECFELGATSNQANRVTVSPSASTTTIFIIDNDCKSSVLISANFQFFSNIILQLYYLSSPNRLTLSLRMWAVLQW